MFFPLQYAKYGLFERKSRKHFSSFISQTQFVYAKVKLVMQIFVMRTNLTQFRIEKETQIQVQNINLYKAKLRSHKQS